MTESEALEFINERIDIIKRVFPEITDYLEALKLSAKALEKQIPKKPIFDFNSNDTLSRFHCACGKIIWVHHGIGTMDNNDAPNYCSNCSIKLDWNE